MNRERIQSSWRSNGASEALQSGPSDTIQPSQGHSNSTSYYPAGSQTSIGSGMPWTAPETQKVNAMPLQAIPQSQSLTLESSHQNSETEDCAMDIERPLNTKKQPARLCSTREIWDLHEGDFFIIPASSGDVYATLSSPVFLPDELPPATLDAGYNDAWVFQYGDDIPKDIIPSSSVLVPRPTWLHWKTVAEIKQFGDLTFHFLISGDGRDTQGRIRPVFRHATRKDSVYIICAILNEARMGFSVIQIWALFRPTSTGSVEGLRRIRSTHKDLKFGRFDQIPGVIIF